MKCRRCRKPFTEKEARSSFRKWCIRCGIELHHERMHERAMRERAEREKERGAA